MRPLPFAIRFAVHTDLGLNAVAAVIGPEHVMLVQDPIAQFGVLVAAGIIVHDLAGTVGGALRALLRWWRRRR
jgi:hypothetical protein